MDTKLFCFCVAIILSLDISVYSLSDDSSAFVQVDSDFRRQNRELLQEGNEDQGEEDEVKDDEERKEVKEEPKVVVEFPKESKNGPLEFYQPESFLMKLREPVLISVFNKDGNLIAKVPLKNRAESFSGSLIDSTNNIYQCSINWKTPNKNEDITIESIILQMNFKKTKNEFIMTNMMADKIKINGVNIMDNDLKIKSSNGYRIKAPLGTSFCCYETGTFKPNSTIGKEYSLGVTLPGVQMQVFDLNPSLKFGPEWDCADMFSIGLWISLLVTLGFGLICFCGFGMLNDIKTMDRFDDPKGKPIHVPASE